MVAAQKQYFIITICNSQKIIVSLHFMYRTAIHLKIWYITSMWVLTVTISTLQDKGNQDGHRVLSLAQTNCHR